MPRPHPPRHLQDQALGASPPPFGAGGLGEARLRAAAPRRAVEVARLGAERGLGPGLALVLAVVVAAPAVATLGLGPGFARGFAAGVAAPLAVVWKWRWGATTGLQRLARSWVYRK